MTVQVEALTYEALKAKCDHLEQINAQTLQVKLTMAETIKELTDRVNALAVENAELKSGCGFFAYDPDNGFEEFNTKDEAIAAAESYIDYYRGEACDGWPDEVAQVSWGIIMQESTRVNERPRDKDDSCDPSIETVCDYSLLPSIETPTTDAALAAIRLEAKIEGANELAERIAEMHSKTSPGSNLEKKLMFAAEAAIAYANGLREAK
ncbi:hypothetical protein [Serratia marcescens]|uniref:hypothetical protein n=1 Tax=Serratia marcescens TaxID=615 RepID=UPI0009494F43|nr:hypothetical protein [Serratia marcescens]